MQRRWSRTAIGSPALPSGSSSSPARSPTAVFSATPTRATSARTRATDARSSCTAGSRTATSTTSTRRARCPVFALPALIWNAHYVLVFKLLMTACGLGFVVCAAWIVRRLGLSALRLAPIVLAPVLMGPVFLNRYDPAARVPHLARARRAAPRPRAGHRRAARRRHRDQALPGGRRPGRGAAHAVAAPGRERLRDHGRRARPAVLRCSRPAGSATACGRSSSATSRSRASAPRSCSPDPSSGSTTSGWIRGKPGSIDIGGTLADIGGRARLGARGRARPRRRLGVLAGPGRRRAQVTAWAAAISAFVVFGKVLSPQYLTWLVPLVPLAAGRRGGCAAIVFFAVLAITQLEYLGHRTGSQNQDWTSGCCSSGTSGSSRCSRCCSPSCSRGVSQQAVEAPTRRRGRGGRRRGPAASRSGRAPAPRSPPGACRRRRSSPLGREVAAGAAAPGSARAGSRPRSARSRRDEGTSLGGEVWRRPPASRKRNPSAICHRIAWPPCPIGSRQHDLVRGEAGAVGARREERRNLNVVAQTPAPGFGTRSSTASAGQQPAQHARSASTPSRARRSRRRRARRRATNRTGRMLSKSGRNFVPTPAAVTVSWPEQRRERDRSRGRRPCSLGPSER